MDYKNRYNQLIQEIKRHAYLYFVENKPEISDAEYDKLVTEANAIADEYPDVLLDSDHLDIEPTRSTDVEKHMQHMYSMDNIHDEQGLDKFLKRFSTFKGSVGHEISDFYCDCKMDGVAIELVYNENKLVKATTRGNGEYGTDVTNKVARVVNIPQYINNVSDVFVVHGEMVIHRNEFNTVNNSLLSANKKPYANPRAMVAGIMMSKTDDAPTHLLRFYAYNQFKDADTLDYNIRMKHLTDLGFSTPRFEMCHPANIMDFITRVGSNRNNLPYDIDGVVIKHNNAFIRTTMGFNQRAPRFAMAWKFVASGSDSTIREIEWSISRNGVLTPVAILSPAVVIDGVTISRVTLNNVSYVKDNNLGVGAVVRVIRSCDVIPKISEIVSVTKSDIPKVCPHCGQPLVIQDTDLLCTNLECKGRLKTYLNYVFGKQVLNVKGIGENTFNFLVDQGYVSDIKDLFNVVEVNDSKLQDKINQLVSRLHEINLVELILMLSIPNMGKINAMQLVTEAGTIEGLIKLANNVNILKRLPINQAVKKSFADWMTNDTNLKLLTYIKSLKLKKCR